MILEALVSQLEQRFRRLTGQVTNQRQDAVLVCLPYVVQQLRRHAIAEQVVV